jgi:hypothetical protein
MKFVMKTPDTKRFGEIFCEAFLIFLKIFCIRHVGIIFFFTKKGSLNPQAVKIRVEIFLIPHLKALMGK